MVRFIGDVHGKFGQYLSLTDDVDSSIQVGDFGMGFGINPPNLSTKHRFIRGNHDSPEACKNDPCWIPDGTVENDMMFIGGALSVDKDYRIEGRDWWRDEELSYNDLQDMIDLYADTKPRVMVTHECPESIVSSCFHWYQKAMYPSRTRQALDAMWQIHNPELWIFGHWHYNVDKTILDTRFICLNELSYIDI